MGDEVKVKFGVRLEGFYQNTVTVSRDSFEEMAWMKDRELRNHLADFIKRDEVKLEVDDVIRFEEVEEGE